jgi:hypothetical protein
VQDSENRVTRIGGQPNGKGRTEQQGKDVQYRTVRMEYSGQDSQEGKPNRIARARQPEQES